MVYGYWRGPLPLRWVYLHVLRELAQHGGHADILREQVLTGQCRCLSAAKYRGVKREHLGGHPAGRPAGLACLAEGVL